MRTMLSVPWVERKALYRARYLRKRGYGRRERHRDTDGEEADASKH